MADSKDDGGPAYPWGEHGTHLGGQTMRDAFAIAALPGVIALYFATAGEEVIAKHAYAIADAMLKESAK